MNLLLDNIICNLCPYIVCLAPKSKSTLSGPVYQTLSDSPEICCPMRISKFDSVVTCASLALLGFFAWHAWEGPRGFRFNEKLKSQSAQLTDDLAAFQKRRTTFERRVALLRPESVDPDMLDEMARQTLEVARPNELIVLDSP